MSDTPALKTTPLTAWHRAHGAKMVEFAGYEMPVQYEGVLAEHAACREHVGLFDITHMGEIEVAGPGAESWLDSLVTNRVAGIPVGKVKFNSDAEVELWPYSTNPKWNAPINLRDGAADGEEITAQIVGLVIGSYVKIT